MGKFAPCDVSQLIFKKESNKLTLRSHRKLLSGNNNNKTIFWPFTAQECTIIY